MMYRVIIPGKKPFVTNSDGLAEQVSKMYGGARIQMQGSDGKWVAYE